MKDFLILMHDESYLDSNGLPFQSIHLRTLQDDMTNGKLKELIHEICSDYIATSTGQCIYNQNHKQFLYKDFAALPNSFLRKYKIQRVNKSVSELAVELHEPIIQDNSLTTFLN